MALTIYLQKVTGTETKEYEFEVVSPITKRGYYNDAEFDIPGGNQEDSLSLPTGGSGKTIQLQAIMRDLTNYNPSELTVDKSRGTHTSEVKTLEEQQEYWEDVMANRDLNTQYILNIGTQSYEVSLKDWIMRDDPGDPLKTDLDLEFKVAKNQFS